MACESMACEYMQQPTMTNDSMACESMACEYVQQPTMQGESMPCESMEESTTNGEEPVINVQLLKKYRAANYDRSDEEYARQMKKHTIPAAFNEFTEGLMDETHINRFGLLSAIDDYNKTETSEEFPLECRFQDAAFNCRPYQPCIIS
jgi:hypothetical protein